MRKPGWALLTVACAAGFAALVIWDAKPPESSQAPPGSPTPSSPPVSAPDDAPPDSRTERSESRGPTQPPQPAGPPDGILIDKLSNTLYLFKGGDMVASYPVATGKEPRFTPEGGFTIANKLREPRGPNSEATSLGNRWMGLAVPHDKDLRGPPNDKRAPRGLKYGIHGTNEPESIGNHASAGCVRMRNEDVIELFDQVEVGMPVVIRPSARSTRGAPGSWP